MDKYLVKTIKNKKNIEVSVPGSKSITNRALMLAAISEGRCELNGVLFSDDSRGFLECLINLGFHIEIDEEHAKVVVQGEGGSIPNRQATIDVRSAGTAARFLTVLLAVAGGDYILNSSEQMKKRPMKELLDLLIEKGVDIRHLENEGHFPFEIHSKGIKNCDITIDTTVSSQYASALLMAGAINGLRITLTGSRTEGAYIKITEKMLNQFGINFKKKNSDVEAKCDKGNGSIRYEISEQKYTLYNYNIEPDMSAACYFYAMAILLRIRSIVRGVHLDSMQGDIKFLSVLKCLGCIVKDDEKGIEVDGSYVDEIKGIDIDMSDFSDQALTMSAIAAFAKDITRIKNIGHIRGQESDRVQVICNELTRIGCKVEIVENEQTDVIITPGNLHGAEIETYDDHRVAMSFALVGLVIDGIIIKNPLCCKKTFENYFDILDDITK